MKLNDAASNTPNLPLYLGCPVWNCAGWSDRVFPRRTPRSEWLRWYSSTFNTVEGNSTFYGLPTRESVVRWASESATGFRFCFKFPRLISHDLQLVNAEESVAEFLDCLNPLWEADRMGPTFLQLGPDFDPSRLPNLKRFLNLLPDDRDWAVEVRHHDWFDRADNEKRLNDLLTEMQIDKVIFDSRPLFQCPPDDDIEVKSQARKPKTPVRQTITGKHPMLRIVGRNKIALADPFFDQWSPIIAKWIGDGLKPYIFTHAPDDAFAPELARRLATRLAKLLPEKSVTIPRPPQPNRQMSLLPED